MYCKLQLIFKYFRTKKQEKQRNVIHLNNDFKMIYLRVILNFCENVFNIEINVFSFSMSKG